MDEPKEIRTVCLADLPVEERKKLCHPSQLDADGNYRLPKLLKEAMKEGHNNVMSHYEAKMKQQRDDDDKRQREKDSVIDNLTTRSKVFEDHARDVEAQLVQTQKDFEEYKRLTESRFDKLAKMISQK
jgi:hypothetical protein